MEFFWYKNGKNPCDTRFSHISGMLKCHNSNLKNIRLKNCNDVAKAISSQQELINERRIKLNKDLHTKQVSLLLLYWKTIFMEIACYKISKLTFLDFDTDFDNKVSRSRD